MDTVLNATLRKVPLFAELKDDELRCVEQGEDKSEESRALNSCETAQGTATDVFSMENA